MNTINPNAPKARMNAVNLVRSGRGVRQVARYFGCSPGTISKWCRKASLLNQRHVIPTESSKPHHSPNRIPEVVFDAIIKRRLNRHPRCGAVIQRELQNEGVKVSVSTVNRVLDRAGLLKKKSKWKRFWRNTPRPVPTTPGDLVELDTIHLRPFFGTEMTRLLGMFMLVLMLIQGSASPRRLIESLLGIVSFRQRD